MIQDMCEGSMTALKCLVGEMGASWLITMVMDTLTEKVRQESLCALTFVGDMSICR